MNSWLKSLIALSILVCVGAFGILGWLALQTTRAPEAAGKSSGWKRMFPESVPGRDVVNQALDQAAAAAFQSLDQLAEKLRQLNGIPGVKPNELLLTFKSEQALKDFRERAAKAGITILSDDPRLLSAHVRYTDPDAMAKELRQNAGNLDNVGLNYVAWVPGLPDLNQVDATNAGGAAPYNNSGLDAIGANGNRSTWGKGIKVAVLDTGVTDHPSLLGAGVVHYDLVKDGQTPNGHGTAMASLIAGDDPVNGGVAPAVQILDIRVADPQGESTTALVAQGIMQAVDEGAVVINISLGTTGDSTVLHRAIEYAQQQGVVVVAAAGNDQQTALSYPAGYEGVVSVAAVDAYGNQAFFSNSGETLTISAPGVGIVSAYSDNRMVVSSGTSQATAITSGVVSTMLSWGYNSQNIVQALVNNAQSTGAPSYQVGAGIVQIPKP
ncbi:thermitase [Prosthecobacter debontii]|uniref:Thermitase n=1 Tax=Prosthecobacter debontii TaxID=48467 RepID=A0A1T4Y880_9BACT|nr:S8 family serine peptidase [Prosthecobacter debontii]SKA97926.1 thermitase [Prosthecobacter debontii]